MLNYLWAGMIIIGIIYGAFTGKMPDITNAALDSAKDAVTLCITMVGVMAFWMGIMEIASRAGIIEMASKKMRPLIRFLFPDIPKEHQANQYITTNFIANFLGLGWAATPAGLMAMKELQRLNREERGRASAAMCMFLTVNMTSLQLVTMNILAYRMEYGSQNPAEIIGVGIAATMLTTLVGTLAAKALEGRG